MAGTNVGAKRLRRVSVAKQREEGEGERPCEPARPVIAIRAEAQWPGRTPERSGFVV